MTFQEIDDSLIAVAMSGGLDSSVTAWKLAREGRPVVGLSMLLWDHSGTEAHGRCCGALDLGDAKRVAGQAGIPHYTLRMDREFRDKVVDPFVDDYLAGRTPSPCVRCNTWIKFDLLLERARRLGATRVATGHYARILEGPDGPELHTAVDAGKDQSYYLFELTREQLAASLFPLGELTKAQVREIAREAGLVVAEKGESMEVCFVSSACANSWRPRPPPVISVGCPPSRPCWWIPTARSWARASPTTATPWASAGASASPRPARSTCSRSSPSATAWWWGTRPS